MEEEELLRFELMDLDEQEDRNSEIYMEQGMQELFWAEDHAQNIPKTKRRTVKRDPRSSSARTSRRSSRNSMPSPTAMSC